MSEVSKNSDCKRTFKLSIYAISVWIAFGIIFYRLKFGFEITDALLWLYVYWVMAVVVGDVLRTIETGKKTPWVIGVMCMPILAIPLYAVLHGKRNAL